MRLTNPTRRTGMRSFSLSAILKTALRGAAVLLVGAGIGVAQTTVNLTAVPSTLTTPDGATVQMWGYSCGAGSTPGACRPASAAAGGWSPVILTAATGSNLTITLTNNLQFANGNAVPTSVVIVG